MVNINKILILIIASALIPIASGLLAFTNSKLEEDTQYLQHLNTKIELCEKLNWESANLHYEIESLDWYVSAMVNNSLITEEEANNTIYKFVLKNTMFVLEIEDQSGINDFEIFSSNPLIILERYMLDLYDDDYFYYNHTFKILINEYGLNQKPFLIFFDINIMEDIVLEFESNQFLALKQIVSNLIITNALFGISIVPLSIKRDETKKNNQLKAEKKNREIKFFKKIKENLKNFLSYSRYKKIKICILFLVSYFPLLFSSGFFFYTIHSYLIYF